MRIIHLSSARTYGGGERHFVDLTRELRSRGHDIFVGLRPTCEWSERLEFLSPDHFLSVSIRNSFGMFSAKRIAEFVKRNEIDVIHAHVARDYVAASVAARLANAKLVLTRHVMFPMKPFQRIALRNVDAAIAVSSGVARQLEKIFSAEKIYIITNGIGIEPDGSRAREELGNEFRQFHSIPTDVPVVATIGELKPLKGQRDLILAASEVIKTHPNVRFVIAGKDNTIDRKFQRELKRLAKVLGMHDNAIWLEWLDDIAPLLAAADIFVSPSHSESFGLAMLDAMAADTPVIATNTDGARELIGDANALVPIKDPVALAERIKTYIDDVDARRSLGATLGAAAREKYSLRRMVDETEAVYRRITANDDL